MVPKGGFSQVASSGGITPHCESECSAQTKVSTGSSSPPLATHTALRGKKGHGVYHTTSHCRRWEKGGGVKERKERRGKDKQHRAKRRKRMRGRGGQKGTKMSFSLEDSCSSQRQKSWCWRSAYRELKQRLPWHGALSPCMLSWLYFHVHVRGLNSSPQMSIDLQKLWTTEIHSAGNQFHLKWRKHPVWAQLSLALSRSV